MVFGGGVQTTAKICQYGETRSRFFLDNKKKTFNLKGDNEKLWVEVFIVTFLNTVTTVNVLTTSDNRAKTAKNVQNNCNALAKLLFCLLNLVLCRRSCCLRIVGS